MNQYMLGNCDILNYIYFIMRQPCFFIKLLYLNDNESSLIIRGIVKISGIIDTKT